MGEMQRVAEMSDNDDFGSKMIGKFFCFFCHVTKFKEKKIEACLTSRSMEKNSTCV